MAVLAAWGNPRFLPATAALPSASWAHDVDLTRPLPSDLIVAAVQADPALLRAVGPYQAMLAPPGRLDAVQARAREIYATGWRPPTPPGPPGKN